VDYLTTNASSIIDMGDPDSSVSTNCHAIAAVIDSINAPAVSMPMMLLHRFPYPTYSGGRLLLFRIMFRPILIV